MLYTITSITEDSFQTQNFVLFNGNTLTILFRYAPLQLGWFMDITYGDFKVTSFRLFTSPNMLRQYSEQIPFGLACYTNDLGEPMQQQDLSSGYATLYILDSEAVASYEAFLSG